MRVEGQGPVACSFKTGTLSDPLREALVVGNEKAGATIKV